MKHTSEDFSMEIFQKNLQQRVEDLQNYLDSLLAFDCNGVPLLLDAMRYSLLGKSKRIRGMLVLGFYELFQKDLEIVYPVASAVEMIHAYSLIQDDLPCLDDDDFRRGVPSCHKVYGEATALLASDGLLNLAFETLLDEKNAFSSETVVKMGRELSLSSGFRGMIGGQMMDMESDGTTQSGDVLTQMHLKKTGALIKASCKLGVIAGGGDLAEQTIAENYGKCLGLAFQIQDDILDVIGDSDLLGKPVGSDVQQKKTTYATLYGVETAKKMYQELYEEAENYLFQLNRNSHFLKQLTKMLRERKF